MLSFFPPGVFDEILNLIESVSVFGSPEKQLRTTKSKLIEHTQKAKRAAFLSKILRKSAFSFYGVLKWTEFNTIK